jgi:hypothetical protein
VLDGRGQLSLGRPAALGLLANMLLKRSLVMATVTIAA